MELGSLRLSFFYPLPLFSWLPKARLGEPFRAKITELCANLTEHYHRHADFSKVTECRQGENETVSQYLERLKYVFNANSGTPEPAPGGDQNTPYHQQLKMAFLTGMCIEISKEVKKKLSGMGVGNPSGDKNICCPS